jgi:hypothetical protein
MQLLGGVPGPGHHQQKIRGPQGIEPWTSPRLDECVKPELVHRTLKENQSGRPRTRTQEVSRHGQVPLDQGPAVLENEADPPV